jgi:phosphoglycerate dehydrogenase-like enzyme
MSSNPAGRFKVRLTADFYDADGSPKFADLGLGVFDGYDPIDCGKFAEHRPTITADQIGDANGVIVLTPAVTAESLPHNEHLIAFGRFGVGYDAVDVEACTAADVLLFITAGAVDRPVAEATVGWMIALTHHMRAKDRLVRTGQWDARAGLMGCELRDRTLGIVGLGRIARKLVELLEGFGMNPPLAFDPFVDAETARQMGVRMTTLDELLASADFISINCPLTDETRDLIGPRELALMKPDAYLINTARGGIVDEDALYDVLAAGKIAGAAIDVFATEPLAEPHRLGELDNVLLAPHCIAWTNEMFRDIGRTACQGMLDLSQGRRPIGVINPEVLDQPGFEKKWKRVTAE